MERSRGRRLMLVVILVIAAIIAILIIGRVAHTGVKNWVADLGLAATIVTVLAPMWGPVRGMAGLVRRPRPPTPAEITAARNNLHAALREAWSKEGAEVYEDLPLQVRFALLDEVGNARVRDYFARSGSPATTQSLAGQFGSVMDAFSQPPRYRRVVLGAAGAGKSVLVTELQRKLVEAARPDDPLPVIVRAAVWRPDRDSLLDWLAHQLAASYGWLPVTHARALVARGAVLPILDGLDEMPVDLRSAAIARINRHHVYRPLVVTSREDEYRAAGHVKGALAVAVAPVSPEDAAFYLDSTGSGRWNLVIADMTDNRGGALARALDNPLMLWLARVEYWQWAPSALTLFSDSASIEDHLLEEFVPSVYSGDSGETGGRFDCTAEQAQRWLGHLAWDSYLEYAASRRAGKPEQGSAPNDRRTGVARAPGLAWWRIYDTDGWRLLGRGVRALLTCGLLAALVIWVLDRSGNLGHGGLHGPFNTNGVLLDGPVGRLMRPTTETIALAIRKSVSQLGSSLAADFVLLMIGAFLLFTLLDLLTLPSYWAPVRLQFAPSGLRRALTGLGYYLGLCVGLSLLVLYFAHWPVSAASFLSVRSTWIALLVGPLVLLLARLPSRFLWYSDTSGDLAPDDSLRLDKLADAVTTVTRRAVLGAAFWLVCGPLLAVAYGVEATAATVIALILGGQGGFASRRYTDAHLSLAVTRRAPWRTMAFLADASRRGVLRQVGAAYQFRHVRLLEQVRNWRPDPPPLLSAERLSGLAEQAIRVGLRAGLWNEVLAAGPVDEGGREPPAAPGLTNAENPAEALEALAETAAAYRNLATNEPAFLPPLSATLHAKASILKARGSREDELAAIRDALDAYRRRAKRIAKIHGQLAAAHLTGPLSASKVLGIPIKPVRREIVRAAVKEATAACRALPETHPAEFPPDLAEAVLSLAASLRTAGLRAEAAVLRDVADEVRRGHNLWVDVTQGAAADIPPLDRRDDLVLRLWKLGAPQAALAAECMRSDLGLPRWADAKAGGWRGFWSAPRLAYLLDDEAESLSFEQRGLSRDRWRLWPFSLLLDEEREALRREESLPKLRAAFLERYVATNLHARLIFALAPYPAAARQQGHAHQDGTKAAQVGSSEHGLAAELERQSDAADTLAFRRRVAGWHAAADDLVLVALGTQANAVLLYEKSCGPSTCDGSHVRSAQDTLRTRLATAGELASGPGHAKRARLRTLMESPAIAAAVGRSGGDVSRLTAPLRGSCCRAAVESASTTRPVSRT